MRFTIQKKFDSARLGLIEGVLRLPDFRLESPNLFLYTKGGTIPHLTPDVFQQVSAENHMLYFPVPSITHLHERMKQFHGSIGDFSGLQNHLIYASIIDSGQKRISGYHTKNHVPIWSKAGKTNINSETYMDFMEALEPDLFLTLCDSDTELNTSSKRIIKSLNRSLGFFEKCMELHNKSERLKSSKIIGPLIGGYSEEARERCSAVVGKAPVFGFAIDGLHDCSRQVSLLDFKQIKPMVKASLKHVPTEKLRICHGPWSPKVVLELVSMGIDILDTSYPYMITECCGALTFPNSESIFEDSSITDQLEPYNEDNISHEYVNAKCGFNDSDEPVIKKSKANTSTSALYILLSDKIHRECFEPISTCCTCLTCRNHTKAYIHHLLSVKELLGSVLLMIHNLHHYFKFFETIRMALKKGKFENMKNNFEKLLCDGPAS